MTEEFVRAQRALREALAHPIPGNPYLFEGGFGSVPVPLSRVMRTADDVVGVVAEAMGLRGLSESDVIARSGVSADEFRAIANEGAGTLSGLMSVLEALQVEAVTIPSSFAPGGGAS